ncbi:MAG: ABC transporter ATP-binding protein [Deltaproteobacteria bacterium]|nr:MAG: ABC transporter ATP-binding protein [Deltaproteobacteria bacterium]HDH87324.1 ABC transporter ATP-binding protein [Desulfobacteraceae bacterium]
MNLLEFKDVTKYFGGLAALKAVSFYTQPEEILGLIGPNGAGKTTLFNLISGVYSPSSGEIYLNKDSIKGLKPYQICKMGVGRTFQIMQPFGNMTILENVLTGVLFGRGSRLQLNEARKKAIDLCEFVGIGDKVGAIATEVTLADQKRMEIARALAVKPMLILFDEVMAGLNPTEIDEAIDLVERVRKMGITIILIEHIMRVVMNICDRVIVLHHGEKIAEGTSEVISKDKEVINAYLGEEI